MADLTNLSVGEILNMIPTVMKPELIAGLDAVIQFRIKGDGGGDWILTLKDGTASITEGIAENPRLTLFTNAQDFKKIVTGKLNGTQAFMLGKIKLTGDMNLAMKLVNLIKL
jgi:putative sterol carrier protein